MGFFTDDKPFTAVTASINQILTEKSTNDFEPEIQLPGLLETIKVQGNEGAIEAARAIRKKLKYGSPTVQYHALVVLELLISNGGKPLVPFYNDDKLLDRLTKMVGDESLIPRVRKKVIAMIIGWKEEFNNDPSKAELVALYRFAKRYHKGAKNPHLKREVPKFLNDTAESDNDDDDDESLRNYNRRRNNLDERYEIPQVDIKKISKELEFVLSETTRNVTNLNNLLSRVNRSKGELAIDDTKCTLQFEKCRQIRRKVLRYLQVVTEGEYLGLLIHANDQLVEVLQKYSDYSQPVSNVQRGTHTGFISEDEDEEDNESFVTRTTTNYSASSSDLEEEDEENPFADSNKV